MLRNTAAEISFFHEQPVGTKITMLPVFYWFLAFPPNNHLTYPLNIKSEIFSIASHDFSRDCQLDDTACSPYIPTHQHIVLLCASKQFFFLLKIKTKQLQVSCTLTYSKFSFLNLLENAFCNCEIARFKLHNHNCKRLPMHNLSFFCTILLQLMCILWTEWCG